VTANAVEMESPLMNIFIRQEKSGGNKKRKKTNKET